MGTKKMKVGIVPNTAKSEILAILKRVIEILDKNSVQYFLSVTTRQIEGADLSFNTSKNFYSTKDLAENCDVILSLGGDGTMLNTAFEIKNFNTPLLGVNIGKLGFLAEFDIENFELFLSDFKTGKYTIEDRVSLEGACPDIKEPLFALNDIVIDKGPWPKMIELTIKINEKELSTFSADGLVISTPTGSTGYSLSVGGPIISPIADVIVLSPIAPHTLTARPLVIAGDQEITIMVKSLAEKIQVSCDGQRVSFINTSASLKIKKGTYKIKLIHSQHYNYYETLRKKLFWGVDARNEL
jgi:NAD+ kinase